MALVVNGTTQYATADLTTPYVMSGDITYTGTFRTAASVTGAERVIVSIRNDSGNYRGLNFRIGADGYFKAGSNTNGSDTFGSSPWLGLAQPNTSYRFVVTKDSAGNLTGYLNTISTTYTRPTTSNTPTLTKVLISATFGSVAANSFFDGEVVRVAVFNTVLSSDDINTCLFPSTTPTDCTVSPVEYWTIVSTSANVVGLNGLTLVSGATIDSDAIVGQTVSSINGGFPIPASASSISSSTTGFTGLPSTITTSSAGLTCSNIGGIANSPTFDISDRVDGGFYPKSGTIVTFTFSDGSESAAGNQAVIKKTTETELAVVSPLFTANTLAQAILDQTGRTVATGDEFYHTVYSDLVITADTDFTVTDAGSFGLWLYVSAGTDAGKNYYYAVTITESGAPVISGGGMTTVGLTSSGLTRVGLASSGL